MTFFIMTVVMDTNPKFHWNLLLLILNNDLKLILESDLIANVFI
jgi:hypothetical protein